MVYIYDILVNFSDSYLYDFYEWGLNDEIENLKKIGLFRISMETMDDLIDNKVQVTEEFLVKIFRTCEAYTKNSIQVIPYACLFSDGSRVLAVEWNSKGISECKSKLILEEEEDVLEVVMDSSPYDFSYQIVRAEKKRYFLTRKELKMKRYLISEINESYEDKKYEKLKFLYEEYFEKTGKDYQSMKNELIESMSDFLDAKHFSLYELLRLSHKKKQV